VTGNVDQLASDEVVSGDFGADVEKRILGDAEFDQTRLGFNFRLGEVTALRLGDILGLGNASAQLKGDITVALDFLTCDDLRTLKAEDRDGDVTSVVLEQAGHPDFLSDHASAHH
jgi:hypothetical protein